MSLATMLPKRMQVVIADVTRQEGGAVDYAWDAQGISYSCDLQPISASKQINLGAMGFDATHTLFWNGKDVAIDETARVIVDRTVFRLVSGKQPSVQRSGWPSQALVVEARI